LMPSQ